jgi:uncharacterized protein YfaT (DUF1175 family)
MDFMAHASEVFRKWSVLAMVECSRSRPPLWSSEQTPRILVRSCAGLGAMPIPFRFLSMR